MGLPRERSLTASLRVNYLEISLRPSLPPQTFLLLLNLATVAGPHPGSNRKRSSLRRTTLLILRGTGANPFWTGGSLRRSGSNKQQALLPC